MEIEYEKISCENLEDIDLCFKPGINCVIGSGASLMLSVLTCSINYEGVVKIGGKICKNIKDFAKSVSYVPESPEELLFNKTVLKEFRVNKSITRLEIDSILKLIGFDSNILDMDPFDLSSGEKRKLSIGLALTSLKKIIVLNNPSMGIDASGEKNLIKLIRELKRNGMNIIIFSNDVEFVHKVADSVYVITDKVLALGSKYDVFKQCDLLRANKIPIPEIMEFSDYVLKNKNIRLGYRDDTSDLMKDVYRSVG
ncbi:MAG: ATP-binding cassette domain-containing protein [Bacilli bacterium]|nr:ATP-binding cassette domain-containing protein [Bacilli bacterium]